MNRFASKIFSLASFKKQFNALLLIGVASNFPELRVEFNREAAESEIDWNNLLEFASILHRSDQYVHLDAALRIAQQCLTSATTTSNQRLSATVILESLTNKPAIKLAVQRELIPAEYIKEIPLPFQLEIRQREVAHSILVAGEHILSLNRFQKSVFDNIDKAYLSISAPTSAGKSFLLNQIILNLLIESKDVKHVVYVVPTRALINQVEQDIRTLLEDNKLSDVFLTTVPQALEEQYIGKSKIFVFTQERLHWFRAELPLLPIHLLIIDEAHKIEDGNRGILLQQKIEDLISDFPEVKIIFSSPFTSNPEILLEDLPIEKTRSPISTQFVSVNQNLIYVSQVLRKPLEWNIDLCTQDDVLHLGSIVLPYRPVQDAKRLLFVAATLADPAGGNLIYANRAYDAEKNSQILFDVLPDEYSNISDDIRELIDLVRKTIHPKFGLVKVLRKKIAFHYGNMPLIVRQEIERLFKKGDIHFIICTSTLLEGVNLPAKSIFIRKPTRGIGNPMNDGDFWNLAGRAGRWGKEFQGNVVCVEPDTWESKPATDRKRITIARAIDRLELRKSELLSFIQNGTPRALASNNLDLEYGFTHYYIKHLRGRFLPNSEFHKSLQNAFEEIDKTITLPKEVIFRNPGISPLALQNLLKHFEANMDKSESLIPAMPESLDAVNQSYKEIVTVTNRYLSGDPEGLAIYQAILIVNWMKGLPLPYLIENSYKYWLAREERSYERVIRDVMKDIEEFARFKFAKYSGAYVDVLRFFLRSNGKDSLVDQIPNLHIWLELGVSQQTQISLIGLGLTRNTAIVLSEFMANDSLNRDECKTWITKNDVLMLPISSVMKSEVTRLVAQVNNGEIGSVDKNEL